MKFFVNDKEDTLWSDQSCRTGYILEFSFEKDDYFMNYRPIWKEVTGSQYQFSVGSEMIEVPSGFYVMIGDVYGMLDWVMVDEAIGRDMQIVVLNREMNQWDIEPIRLISQIDEKTIYWPQTKNCVPVHNDSRLTMLIGDKDFHFKTKDMLVTSFITS